MKVLFTTRVLEHPAIGGPALRVENSIKALSRVCDLFIVSRLSKSVIGQERAESFYKEYCREFLYAPSARWSRNRYVRKLQTEWHKAMRYQDDERFIIDQVDEKGVDVLWCGFGNRSFELIERIKAQRPLLKIVCDTDSVWSRFELRELPFETDPKQRKKIQKDGYRTAAWERKIVYLCEVTTAVSEVDAVYYRAIANDPQRVMIFSNGIDLKTYEAPHPFVAGFKKPCIYLAGSFFREDCPMHRAARWIVEKVFPTLQKAIPDIHFYIVGKGSDVICGKYNAPAITVTGKVSSVLPYLCHSDVALVPLQFESGTRFKIMEAGACKVPIVSTALGAEGIPVIHEQDILLADNPEDFTRSIIRLIRDKDLATWLKNNCYELIRKKYSVEYLSTEAELILQKLGAMK
ncbi:MAG: glycosyltransferase [Candidatus Omnitrophica bacterium]|nr:glycosyltransferase [Candidatus Omnitrophota bacterium]